MLDLIMFLVGFFLVITKGQEMTPGEMQVLGISIALYTLYKKAQRLKR
jgi:hypothetical protein